MEIKNEIEVKKIPVFAPTAEEFILDLLGSTINTSFCAK